ncbi:MAG TPA: CoA transferase [Pseudonocardia sp.]|jgi:CoA:oxalate CoA-transferase|nr:CoA transferase [Pseudonocardia sp.]
MEHVLAGYKILDLTQVLSGPSATRLMAEAGAEVVKVEWPGGDPARNFPYLGEDGRSAYYVQQNRGKRSVAIDLRTPEGAEIVKELAAQCDVLIENFSPGAMDRLGLGYDVIKSVNPSIVMCSISAFGQSGPLSHLVGFDYIPQAYSGITSVIGDPDKPPVFPMAGIGDVSTGVHAACAIAFALLYRERTGKGQYLDVALLDCYFHYHEVNVQIWSCTGGEIKPTRSGSHHNSVAPAGIFKSKDSYILVLALLRTWPRLCEAIGRPELIEDRRFIDNAARMENYEALIEIIEGWLTAQESDAAAIRILDEHRVPVAPILTVEQACQHPHLIGRETIRTIYDRTLGNFQVPGMPLRFSEFPGHLDLEAPYLGEHNAEVLSEWLGYSPERINDLAERRVLDSEPIPEQHAPAMQRGA